MKDIQCEVRNIISEIEEKSADGDYIYRGEPKTHTEPPYYGKVSSNLYRRYGLGNDVKDFDFNMKAVQEHILREGKRYLREENDEEILIRLQHYGGRTNQIDFTYDYLIALFFACDGAPRRRGRVILLNKNRVEDDYIIEPQSSINRVRDQKSVFVSHPKGFIEKDCYKIIYVPTGLKDAMLDHIEKYHHISAHSVYHDLHGLIRIQKLHEHAYIEFFKGVTRHEENRVDEAINHYTKAIELHHGHVEALNNRGVADYHQGEHDSAIADCTRAIELDSRHANAYHNRGLAYRRKAKYSRAIKDLTKAIELDLIDADTYYSRGNSYLVVGKPSLAIADLTKAIELKSNHFTAYSDRGIARLHLAEFERAEMDLLTARRNGVNIIERFNAMYHDITNFHTRTGINLPRSIVEILTAAPS